MDNRGTGRSGAVDCHELETEERATVESVARCGDSLGTRAALYSTAYAADDLAAVLEALGISTIDLYGDSYGTYFEQAFAVRHPAMLRSIVLDGAYPLNAPDYAWYPTYAPAMRAKFDIACRRSAACAALPGTSIEHIQPALDALRAASAEARAPDVDGNERRFRADAAHLALVMFGGAPALASIRETDAAARAFAEGDRLPLERLMAETDAAVDSRDPTADVSKWSAGLAVAVMCQDPPQIFDMNLPPAERLRDRDRALAERRRSAPDTYAPFTIDEYRAMPLDYSFIDQCVAWPVPPPGHPAPQLAAATPYPDIPALVISGELDAITTPADGAAVAAAFRRGTQVLIANSFHVNALPHARSRFIRTLTVADAACASQVPPLRLVPRFARTAAELDPAQGLPGNGASPELLRFAAAATYTAGDVLARVDANSSGRGVGLRGGSFRLRHDAVGVHVVLDQVRWTEDLAVSGTIDRPVGPKAAVHADLILMGGAGGRLNLSWREGDQADTGGGLVQLRGNIGSAEVAAQNAAP
jgi:pimeloyl-ACP methyl ester carboxylesterase